MKTEKQIWIESEIKKIVAQNLSAELTEKMIKMVKDFADWSF